MKKCNSKRTKQRRKEYNRRGQQDEVSLAEEERKLLNEVAQMFKQFMSANDPHDVVRTSPGDVVNPDYDPYGNPDQTRIVIQRSDAGGVERALEA